MRRVTRVFNLCMDSISCCNQLRTASHKMRSELSGVRVPQPDACGLSTLNPIKSAYIAAFIFVSILLCAPQCQAATRHYYIAAEDVQWDYAPSHRDLTHGSTLPVPWVKKTEYPKTRYIEYTDKTFTVRKPQPEWLGILGPIIRAEVGDKVVIDFVNRSHFPVSIHTHGIKYDKASEGSFYMPAGGGSEVRPDAHYTYHYDVTPGSGPGPGDPSSIVWWYHSNEPLAVNAGLMGPIIITAKGKAKPDGSPKDVDQEFVASFVIFDELRGNEAGLFHAMNGYIFGNLPGLVAKEGSRIRWYLMAMGGEKDLHTPHWHGMPVTFHRHHTDVLELLPASTATADMIADNPGTWMFHCQVHDHMEAGMMAVYTIYRPERACPIRFAEGNFWNNPQTFSVSIKNVSPKPIKTFSLVSGMFLSRMELWPADLLWSPRKALAPGAEQKITAQNESGDPGHIMGFALYPFSITYADGSKWKSRDHGECFQTYWRDKEHPNLKALPPFQVEHEDD